MNINIISHNAQGLNEPIKRGVAIKEYQRLGGDVIFVQETHFKKLAVPKYWGKAYKQTFHSTATEKKRGVTLLIHNRLTFRHTRTQTDPEGRYVAVHGTIHDQKITFLNIYAPNTDQKQFFTKISDLIMGWEHSLLIIGGDMNTVLDPSTDKSTATTKLTPPTATRALKHILRSNCLIDSWRIMNPTDREYTFYSPRHLSHSRIDYLFIQQHLSLNLEAASIRPISWSDHDLVLISLSGLLPAGRSPSWALNPCLLNDLVLREKISSAIVEYFGINSGGEVDGGGVWAAHKAVIRGVCIQLGAAAKKADRVQIRDLNSKITELQSLFARNHDPKIYNEILKYKHTLNTVLRKKVVSMLQRTQASFFMSTNKPDSMLARKLKAQRADSFIPKIFTKGKGPVSKPDQIADVFRQFYTELYSAPSHSGSYSHKSQIDEFLSGIQLPQIEESQAETLADPITAEEIKQAIKATRSHAAPGPDGFTNFYYKQYIDLLLPHLQELFNSFLSGSSFRPEFLEAKIIVIPKEGKDPAQCGSYRPISLINTDLKLYSKIMANRLAPLLPDVIHPDQVGFISGREAPDNTRRIFNLIDLATREDIPLMLLSLDAEKAFDRIDWTFMWKTLAKFGLGDGFLKGIMPLYSDPRACIIYQGFVSKQFNITRGTRQGCPLSPLLFALSLEPLAAAVRNCPNIKGVQIGPNEHKLNLFADDIMLSLTDPIPSLPNLFQLLTDFGRVSGFKINTNKSIALNITLPQTVKQNLENSFPIKWAPKQITYLGIHIPRSIALVYEANFPPVFNRIKADISKWSFLNISWLGRINSIKMNVIPKLLYLFRTIPTPIRLPDLRVLQKTLFKFAWNNKKPRINRTTMCAPKQKGGLAFPDLIKYYKATRLAQTTTWFKKEAIPVWADIERQLLEDKHWVLSQVLWLSLGRDLRTGELPICISHSLKLWKDLNRRVDLLSVGSGLIPLWQSHKGQHLNKFTQMKWWIKNKITIVADTWVTSQSNTSSIITDIIQVPHREWLNLMAINETLTHSTKINKYHTKSPFEKCCINNPGGKANIAIIYNQMVSLTNRVKPHYQTAWEADLQVTLDDSQWNKILKQANTSSLNVTLKENSFKTIMRWYLTPARLHLLNKTHPDTCFRGCTDTGTLIHMLWECPKIRPIWTATYDLLETLLGTTVTQKPEEALLGLPITGLFKSEQCLTTQIFLATRCIIAKHWKLTSPTHIEVLHKIRFIRAMSSLSAEIDERYRRWASCWDLWTLRGPQ